MNKKKKQKIMFYLATKFGWLFILGLGKSLFIKEKGRRHLNKLLEKKARFILVLWHGRMFTPIYIRRREGICPMVSLHADGEMIAQTMYKLGYRPVRGSSTRGGKEAFYEMVNRISQGSVGAIIPDGPTGPRHQFKPGTLYIAQQADAYLLPMTFSANKNIVFKSWDKFMLPMPFSKNIVLYGKPIKLLQNISPRELVKIKNNFEGQMIKLELQADEYFRK
ncbi:lysophospholipid acyltransferase family protein [candidate division KSB1 bacterium]|nr:lysophospholipid acyltransferase family protein [candidate division KSB1 bacterium]MBL7095196.1 lysophospholipid acyltransferase family protein [candidate division KSB1 bacterium]